MGFKLVALLSLLASGLLATPQIYGQHSPNPTYDYGLCATAKNSPLPRSAVCNRQGSLKKYVNPLNSFSASNPSDCLSECIGDDQCNTFSFQSGRTGFCSLYGRALKNSDIEHYIHSRTYFWNLDCYDNSFFLVSSAVNGDFNGTLAPWQNYTYGQSGSELAGQVALSAPGAGTSGGYAANYTLDVYDVNGAVALSQDMFLCGGREPHYIITFYYNFVTVNAESADCVPELALALVDSQTGSVVYNDSVSALNGAGQYNVEVSPQVPILGNYTFSIALSAQCGPVYTNALVDSVQVLYSNQE